MSSSLEIEKTYLAKYIPTGLYGCKSKKIIDIYIPESGISTLRLRQSGDRYELTKKVSVLEGDASQHTEYTIPLSENEFALLSKLSSKKIIIRN